MQCQSKVILRNGQQTIKMIFCKDQNFEKQCRYCYSIEDSLGKLTIRPCKCTDEIHLKCLQTWIDMSGITKCEICKEQFPISPRSRFFQPNNSPVPPAATPPQLIYENYLVKVYQKDVHIPIDGRFVILYVPTCVGYFLWSGFWISLHYCIGKNLLKFLLILRLIT